MDIDPLVRLAANAVAGERKYILLAGAGLSKDAGQHTAWDIVMEAAKLIRAATHEDSELPLQDWFLASQYAGMTYAEMISRLYPNATEQQAFLERMLTVRAPGRAHNAIAELCRRGILRSIVTTNFDILLETALRERGIEPQVIASDMDFQNAIPLIHCQTVRVYKPHGTLGTGRLRNTPADVNELPTEIASELLRVFDDHGIIVVGYGGAEQGLMKVLQGRRRNLYPVYWMHLEGGLPTKATEVCGDALFSVQIQGASAALDNLIAVQDRLNRISSTGASIDTTDAIAAIKDNRKDVSARIKEFFSELTEAFIRLSPRSENLDSRLNPNCDETFLTALKSTVPYILQYTKLAAAVAEFENEKASEVIRNQLHLMGRAYDYRNPVGVSVLANEDFVKFLVQEMFVTQVACLVREGRWTTLAKFIAGHQINHNGEVEGWREFCVPIRMLDTYRKGHRNLNRISVARDVYEERHTAKDALSTLMPYGDLEDADWLLTFVTGFMGTPGEPDYEKWLPRVSIDMERVPTWLSQMKKRMSASEILPLIRMDISEPHNLAHRENYFKEHFWKVATLNKRVWTSGFLRGIARYEKGIVDEFFTVS